MTAPLPRPASDSAPPTPDGILGTFVDYVVGLGLDLYPAQEEAIFDLFAGKHVVLSTPTGSGKSLVATAMMYKALCEGRRGFYSCPVKALVNEKFFDLCRAFGPENVGLMTGDASVNRDAPILCGTAEILANLALRLPRSPADYVVMDEFHYYSDRERGIAWQLPLITCKDTLFLLMSATLGDMTAITTRLHAFTGREVNHVRGMQRPVPLEFEYRDTPLHETILDLVQKGRAPIYLVNFTQRSAAEQAQNLTSIDLCDREDKAAIKDALVGERFASPYGKEIQRYLRVGIGLHHAGLLPRYRRLVERLAQRGLLKVVSGTDTLGVGVNIPIRTVLFTQLCKFDGDKDAILGVREFLQIAGRAGRKGYDDIGYVVAQAPAHIIENKRLAAKGKKFVRRQPPKKGFVHWDQGTFDRLIAGTPEPLESRFAVDHGLLLAVLQSEGCDPRRGGGYRRLLDVITAAHESDANKRRHKRTAAQQFRTLRAAELVSCVRDEKARNPYPVPSADLQEDFSLTQTLALYLVDTLDRLDREAETYPLDVLALVESVLENPRAILLAQLDVLKGDLVAQLKAEGVEYEQRMEELEKLEWPKPNRDFIYETFNAFAEHHPWIGQENIAPKGIAREIIERRLSFSEYVRELGIARSEGVLLRYLSDACRTLDRGVPLRHKNDAIDEVLLSLEATLRIVDASLFEEWRALRDPDSRPSEPVPEGTTAGARQPRRPLHENARALLARVRSELHRLLGALAQRDFTEALECVLPEDEAGQPWTEERLASELRAYFSEFERIDTTPAARAPGNTVLTREGDRIFAAAQKLVDPDGNDDWAIFTRIDLSDEARAGLPEEAPILTLRRIGV